MKKILLSLILIAAATLRFVYCSTMPVSGDECISLLQASGKATVYAGHLSTMPVSSEAVNWLIEYSDDFSVVDVFRSMRLAGMHPPFYYVFLHYILKYAGNDILSLRIPSILFSIFSIAAMYGLSRSLFPKISAWPAALLLAFSPYGIHYAHMIRPYPLVMFLSLLSTWLMVRMVNHRTITPFCFSFWGYLLTIMLGLYTIYHFVFVLVFQWIFLLLASRHDKRQLLTVLAIPLIVALFYLPWLPSMADQLHVVNSDAFYFHGKSSPFNVYRYFLEFDLTQALPGTYSWYKFALAIAVTAAVGLGGLWSLKTPAGRFFAAAMAGYFMFNLFADWKMQTQTLNISKLLFFIIPLLFLYLAAGTSLLIKYRRIPGVLVFGVVFVVLLFNAFILLKHPTAEDDPAHLSSYRTFITETSDSDDSQLIVVNELSRRYLLPVAHTIHLPHLDFLANEDILESLRKLDASKYSRIYIISPRYDNAFTTDAVSDIRALMEQKNFVYEAPSSTPETLRDKRIQFYKRK